MKIAERLNKSISEVMEFTTTEIDYWRVYLSKEPSTSTRNEFLLTQLLNMFHHANSKNSNTKPNDFAYPSQWHKKVVSEDQQIINLFQKTGKLKWR